MRLNAHRLDVVLLGRLEIGVAEEIGMDADLLGRAVDQLGHGEIPEKVGPNVPAEGLLGAGSICCRIAALRMGRPHD